MTNLTTVSRSNNHEYEENGRESVWTFPRRWRFRFFVIFYCLVIGSTAWGVYEIVVTSDPNELTYRNFIVVYVQSIAGSVVTSMLTIDLMRSITMLSNVIEDWLIEKRKKREAKWRAEEERLRGEGFDYGRLVATCEAEGKEPPAPPWETNQN